MTLSAPELSDRIAAADRALAGGNLPEARAVLEAAAQRDPTQAEFWQRLATVRKMAGAPMLAVTAARASLSIRTAASLAAG